MELFEQMRREYEHGVGTIKGVARKFGVHRRMVREALGSALPQDRKQSVREKPKLSACVQQGVKPTLFTQVSARVSLRSRCVKSVGLTPSRTQ